MTARDGLLGWIEARAATLFLAGAFLIAVNAVIVTVGIATGSEELTRVLGEAVNAAGWAILLVGLVGVALPLADRSPWLARIGAGCAAIGVVVFVAISGLSFAFYFDLFAGEMQDLVPLILPGVIVGSILSFLAIGVASLRTDVHSTGTGVLLLAPAVIVVVNIATGIVGLDSSWILLGVVIALAVVMAGIGLRLRAPAAPVGGADPGQTRPAG